MDDKKYSGSILIVDDNHENLTLLSQMLMLAGYSVQTALNGRGAIEKAAEMLPDLIMLDIKMPGLDGFQACKILKADTKTCNIPVMFVTALCEIDDKIRGFEVGGVDFIIKPFNHSEILARVKTHVELSVLRKTLEMQTIELKNTNNILKDKISEQKSIASALQESEEKFSVAFNMAPNAIIISSPTDGNIIDINEAFTTLSGYSRNEALGNSSPALGIWVHEEDRNRLVRKLLSGSKIIGQKFKFKKKDGDIRTGMLSSHLITIKNNSYILSIIDDDTERCKVEDELRESEIIFSTMFQSSPVTITLTTPYEGTILDVNNTFLRDMEYTREEVIGRTTTELGVFPDLNDRLNLINMLKDKGTVFGYECNFKTKSGKIVIGLISIVFIKLKGKTCQLSTIIDITKRKQFEEELIRAKEKADEMNRLKSNFMANMSHELRTPMIGINGFSEILCQELTDPTLKDMAETIYASGQRLSNTLNSILDLTKLETESMGLNIESVAIQKEIGALIDNMRIIAEQKNLYLKSQFNLSTTSLRTDKNALHAIMSNLIGNAIKFTKSGGVTADIQSSKDTLTIKIIDTGIGIDSGNFNYIFEEFRQISEGLSRNYEGTGLGLSITKKMIDQLGGKLSLESKLGKGSTFIAELPIHSPLEKYLPVQKVSVKKSGAPSKIKSIRHLLLVDDDPVVLQILLKYLGNKYVVDYADSGEKSLELITHKNYSIIFMDINLKHGKDGIQTTIAIRENENYLSTPIVALTAYAVEGDREQFIAAGCTHYISKPFKKAEILDLIESILDDEESQTDYSVF